MLNYNICFVKRGDQILLLNRAKAPWMGCWNGIGGKLEPGEQPRAAMVRELEEETGIVDCSLTFKGIVTWTKNGANFGGMYLYLAEIPEHIEYETPRLTVEGILDWKSIDWILNRSNQGLAANIPESLERMMHDTDCYEHRCTYADGRLVEQHMLRISPLVETEHGMITALNTR
ncbi:8-oxo-dGTP diphosphatase [Paenibacillus sp. JCM 10914]|uniref:NUDIX hydrolase n=1 Tax=Paenibacillus sp. JCM 10914 TaxID=1236974 RepID=UPI0003CC29C8|nr:8-oxo-dGTP diphosphatase [Paenibacillus sp. JCM 10914]GAE06837.1 MutT/nudix family protein [Paenibacillus sp. JCM 10914]